MSIKEIVSLNTQRLPYLDENGRLTQEAEELLAEPFAVDEIKWKPQSVKKAKDGGEDTATVIAYADSRVYYERLDQVFGAGNWSSNLSLDSSPYRAEKVDWKSKEVTIKEGHKIYVIASLSISGLGTKSSSGDCETDNENAVTVAEAQAFKRACSMLGIGRYLYFLPKYENFPIKYGKLQRFPQLPVDAIPKTRCGKCSTVITDFKFTKNGEEQVMAAADVITKSKAHAKEPLCGPCFAEHRAATRKPPQSEKEKVAGRFVFPLKS